jgi:hypothetical protein
VEDDQQLMRTTGRKLAESYLAQRPLLEVYRPSSPDP